MAAWAEKLHHTAVISGWPERGSGQWKCYFGSGRADEHGPDPLVWLNVCTTPHFCVGSWIVIRRGGSGGFVGEVDRTHVVG